VTGGAGERSHRPPWWGLWALAVWPTVAAGKAWFLAEMVRLYDHAAPANPKYQEWLY